MSSKSSEFRVQSSEFIRAKKQANRLGKPYKPLPTSIGQQRLDTKTCACTTQHTHPVAALTHSCERAWHHARPPREVSAWAGLVPRRQASALIQRGRKVSGPTLDALACTRRRTSLHPCPPSAAPPGSAIARPWPPPAPRVAPSPPRPPESPPGSWVPP